MTPTVRLSVRAVFVFAILTASLPAQDFDANLHKTAPSPETSQRIAANAALESHDYALALKLLTPLAAANPKDPHLLYDLASTQDALDQTSAAEQSYRAAIAADPAYLDPHVALGLLLARADRTEAARAEFVQATQLPGENQDPTLKARAFRSLARLDRKSRPTDAAAELLEALKLSPETPDDILLSAELAAATPGRAPDAEAAYRHLLALAPNDPAASASLAHLLLQQKRPAEAEPILIAALAAHPGDPALTAQLAAVYQSQGKPAEAIRLVAVLHSADPQNPTIARLLANLYLDANDDAHAAPLLTGLLAQSPRDTTLAQDLARALIHLHRPAEAQALLTPLVAQPALFPTPADLGNAASALAFASSENNDPISALRAIEVRATVLPPSAPVLFLSAISHDKLHHTKLAQQAYKDFLAASNGSNPDEEFEARHRLIALEHMK